MKDSQVGLCSVWLSGFVLIGISLYATLSLPPLKDQIANSTRSRKGLHDLGNLKITIFSAPRPFIQSVGTRQSLAVRSWLALSPQVTVVLFSQDPSVFNFAQEFGSRVTVEPNIDFTFLGTPFFHSMMARSFSFKSDVYVMVYPEVVLFSDLISTLNYAHKFDHDWLLVASLQNISYLDKVVKHLESMGGKLTRTQEETFGQSWQWNPCKGKMLIAWNKGDMPLHSGVLPPFLYREGVHDKWVINEALSSELRFVFDASWTIASSYPNDEEPWSDGPFGDSNASVYEQRRWENVGNSKLGELYGTLFHYRTNYSNLTKLFKCDGKFIFVDTTDNIVRPIGNKKNTLSLWKGSSLRYSKKSRACVDILKSSGRTSDCLVMDEIKLSERLVLPFSLESLLQLVADNNKSVVLAVAGYSYKDVLMSWVCRLHKLRITNFIISALDEETYQFSILQGLPVFKDVLAPSAISFNNCHFGTKCFQRVTKVKSRTVLRILKLGYNVLLSDVDVYWFENPLPFLHSFGPAVFVAQSDEYNITGPINLPRRLNSGFYFAPSDSSTIAAMEKVVMHAENSGMSEQPSFYDTLCGEGGSNRVGQDKCVEPETNLTVYFLDRNFFPNGAYLDLWQEQNVRDACRKKGCLVIHNNWISGRQKKLERQLLRLAWDIDHEHKKKKRQGGPSIEREYEGWEGRSSISLDFNSQSANISVRIVHPGGRRERYCNAVLASDVMKKYPGMFVARPEVFKDPHESLLKQEEYLLPGQKYYMVPSSTAKKLKRKHPAVKAIECKEGKDVLDGKIMNPGGERLVESDCCAKEFNFSRERWARSLMRKGIKGKKPFLPPFPKARSCKGVVWEPSLTSIQELSP